ncbi:hypothetical protein LCGC14_1891830 [marine sediment metagenome]|uniref:Uncharacterized protein n=1 Tax=marine sediment metagenome TaxID=412755 RepID=A0A0F9GMF8_9ZZZZ
MIKKFEGTELMGDLVPELLDISYYLSLGDRFRALINLAKKVNGTGLLEANFDNFLEIFVLLTCDFEEMALFEFIYSLRGTKLMKVKFNTIFNKIREWGIEFPLCIRTISGSAACIF